MNDPDLEAKLLEIKRKGNFAGMSEAYVIPLLDETDKLLRIDLIQASQNVQDNISLAVIAGQMRLVDSLRRQVKHDILKGNQAFEKFDTLTEEQSNESEGAIDGDDRYEY